MFLFTYSVTGNGTPPREIMDDHVALTHQPAKWARLALPCSLGWCVQTFLRVWTLRQSFVLEAIEQWLKNPIDIDRRIGTPGDRSYLRSRTLT